MVGLQPVKQRPTQSFQPVGRRKIDYLSGEARCDKLHIPNRISVPCSPGFIDLIGLPLPTTRPKTRRGSAPRLRKLIENWRHLRGTVREGPYWLECARAGIIPQRIHQSADRFAGATGTGDRGFHRDIPTTALSSASSLRSASRLRPDRCGAAHRQTHHVP